MPGLKEYYLAKKSEFQQVYDHPIFKPDYRGAADISDWEVLGI